MALTEIPHRGSCSKPRRGSRGAQYKRRAAPYLKNIVEIDREFSVGRQILDPPLDLVRIHISASLGANPNPSSIGSKPSSHALRKCVSKAYLAVIIRFELRCHLSAGSYTCVRRNTISLRALFDIKVRHMRPLEYVHMACR
jgi:hypothetical protein